MMFTVNYDATAMFSQFRVTCSCDGKDNEFIVFTRIGRGTRSFLVNNVRWGLMHKDSKFIPGDTIIDNNGNHLFLVAKTDSYRADKGEFYKTNCTISIKRLEDKYDGYDIIGKEETSIAENIDAVYEDVSGRMKLYDVGLLDTTTKRFIVPDTVDIKLLDRIYLLGEKLKVDYINKSTFPKFLYVQVSIDNR